MNVFWPSLSGPNTDFWSHEWSKHGTCAALQDALVGSQEKFFNQTLALRAQLGAEAALSAKGIIPSNSQSYAAADVASAIGQGFDVVLACDNAYLNSIEICYDQGLNRIDCDASQSNCPLSLYLLASTK